MESPMICRFTRYLGLGLLLATCGLVQAHPIDGQTSLAPMLEQVTPAVVNISVEKVRQVRVGSWLGRSGARQARRFTSAGSGLIIDAEEGYVVTNHHVIDRVEKIRVTLSDRREFVAEVVGSDPSTDVALLRIEADDLQALDLGNSDDIRVGDFVVAIGNPFGLGQTVTSGIISALGRTGLDIEEYEDFIQTDASINPGNSGGPLMDLQGRVIGINTAIVGNAGSIGIGFAIPSNMAHSVITQLIEHGYVDRGTLGIGTMNITADLAEDFRLDSLKGAIVKDVVEGSTGEAAGLRIEDIIVSIDGREVVDGHAYEAQIGLRRVGDLVEVAFLRDGQLRTVNAKVGREIDLSVGLSPQLNGVSFDQLRSNHEGYRRLKAQGISGVVIAEIDDSSICYSVGLRKNDVITHLNRETVTDMTQFRKLATEQRIQALKYYRDGRAVTVVFPDE